MSFTETTKTNPDELQERGGIEHQRVFDPELYKLLKELVDKIDKINTQLELITGSDI